MKESLRFLVEGLFCRRCGSSALDALRVPTVVLGLFSVQTTLNKDVPGVLRSTSLHKMGWGRRIQCFGPTENSENIGNKHDYQEFAAFQ
jgi:hypothetical protein